MQLRKTEDKIAALQEAQRIDEEEDALEKKLYEEKIKNLKDAKLNAENEVCVANMETQKWRDEVDRLDHLLPVPVAKNFVVPTTFRSGSILTGLNFGERLSELVEMDGLDDNYYTKDFKIDKVIIENKIFNNIQGTIKNGDLRVIGINNSNILTIDNIGDNTIYANNPFLLQIIKIKLLEQILFLL